ncbi:PIN domain-like protein [Rhizopogon vinicolor AM-OR11-026]|uniref:PIN domain-like protein n=1 Tax=Rhizopogon vinicolor AM-OR11-026 TaxID=1314800 RepID=A0A1B7NFJ4_9AGAM|nr:PIN domain-like protein [Rhizopogon vinicolor AM-OR11-026]
MGVHGLTTYLRENQRILSKAVEFPSSSNDVTSIVVDGWSFIYELYEQSKLPWVYGGEYDAFSACVGGVVKAWIAVGLRVYFVFDGSAPELKFPTLVNRLNHSIIERSLLFFRTSAASRLTPRFLHETRMIPPLAYHACLHALHAVASSVDAMEVHFADEEGDPYAVELAGRLGAFVVGNDSDFVILNSGKYAGYIQLDDMLWAVPNSAEEGSGGGGDEHDEFRTVKKGKTKKQNATQQGISRGLIPPEHSTDLTLSVSVYTPATLASHFKIPVTLLPLLGALVGNDFSNRSSTQRNVQSLFFERQLTLSQRIARVGSTLNEILSASTRKRKARHQVGSVMDLIDRSVHALLIRPPSTMASGEIDAIVDRIVNATLQYAIDKYDGDRFGPDGLWPSKICALHRGETCRLSGLFSRALLLSSNNAGEDNVVENQFLQLQSLYIPAYRLGHFQPKLMDILSTGTFWPKLFLENPDVENVARSIGRPIREWIYAILEDAVGLPEAPEEIEELDDEQSDAPQVDDEDEDELIDVVEEDSEDDGADLLAPLRGELQRLRAPDEESAMPASTSSRSRAPSAPRPKYITEYVRRGTRVASEEVEVPDLGRLLASYSSVLHGDSQDNWTPLPLRTPSERMSLFLHALRSSTAAVEELPSEQLMGALVLRWVVQIMHLRALESPSKERENERWTKSEACALLAFYMSQRHCLNIRSTPNSPGAAEHVTGSEATPMNERSIQLMAQVLVATESIHQFSEVLLLTERVPVHVHILSGQSFYTLLTQKGSNCRDTLPQGLWEACMEGLEGAFAEERPVKTKKSKVNAKRGEPVVQKVVRVGTKGSKFGLLADLQA